MCLFELIAIQFRLYFKTALSCTVAMGKGILIDLERQPYCLDDLSNSVGINDQNKILAGQYTELVFSFNLGWLAWPVRCVNTAR